MPDEFSGPAKEKILALPEVAALNRPDFGSNLPRRLSLCRTFQSMQTCQLDVQVELREESPALLEGAALDEADPVKQLAQKLDACALEDRMDAIVKTEDSPSPGEAPPSATMLTTSPLRTVTPGQKLAACLLEGAARPSQQVRQCAAVLLALPGIMLCSTTYKVRGEQTRNELLCSPVPSYPPLMDRGDSKNHEPAKLRMAVTAGRHGGNTC